jgi:hypothetical protein
MPLVPHTVADFYVDFTAALAGLGISVSINPMPTEVADAIACDVNRRDASYDPDPVHRWWRIQLQLARLLERYRSPFVGKSSPVNFYWGSFDLNHTRFSGRPAPLPAGPRFYQLAESQENFACGFWPGNPNMAGATPGDAALYAYIYPEPVGFKDAAVQPHAARYDPQLGEFILPYAQVRRAESPEQVILDFFETTYAAAATLANWDRQALEAPPPAPRT